MGSWPASSLAILAASLSTPITSFPLSARQVAVTSPTYPVPTTATFTTIPPEWWGIYTGGPIARTREDWGSGRFCHGGKALFFREDLFVNQFLPEPNPEGQIDAENGHRRSPGRRPPTKDRAAPAKMARPLVSARVKQRHDGPRRRVDAGK